MEKLRASHCTNLQIFANYVDKKEEIKGSILQGTAVENDSSVLAKLKMAWRQAEAIVERGIKRTSEGLSEECHDEPLDSGIIVTVNEEFKRAYGWTRLPLDRLLSDNLFGRVYREFQCGKLTLMPVLKVKSAASSQHRAPSQRRKLGEDLALVFAASAEDEDAACGSLLVFCDLLEILVSSWALAGAHKVTYQNNSVRFVYWPDADGYLKHIKSTATPLLIPYTESSVLAYVLAVEEMFRMKAISLVRGDDEVPFGIALSSVIDRYGSYWDHKKDLLVKRNPRQPVDAGSSSSAYDNGKGGKGGKNPKGGGKADTRVKLEPRQEDGAFKKNWQTYRYDSQNNVICSAYNDNRGCKQSCPWKQTHCCDVLLSNNKICGSRSHGRRQHLVHRDGAPKLGKSK